jgi:hypothetical protein
MEFEMVPFKEEVKVNTEEVRAKTEEVRAKTEEVSGKDRGSKAKNRGSKGNEFCMAIMVATEVGSFRNSRN